MEPLSALGRKGVWHPPPLYVRGLSCYYFVSAGNTGMLRSLGIPGIKSSYNRCLVSKNLALAKRCFYFYEDVLGHSSRKTIHDQVPHKGSYKLEDCESRRKWVEQFTSASLSNVGQWWDPCTSQGYSTENLKGNIENPIGLAKIPLGVAGPLLIKGDYVQDELIVCPFAITEGAVVASVSRGATAITRCGGVTARVIKRRITRVPHFVTDSMHQAHQLSEWFKAHLDELKSKASEVSQHCKLQSVEPWFIGRNLLMEFVYDSADAAGQNGVTVTTSHACKWAMEKIAQERPDINIREYFIETKLSGDKSAVAKNFLMGRGIEVQAETYITESALKRVLKVDSHKMTGYFKALQLGTQRSGLYGINIAVCNMIAAISAATGQDLGSVHENSMAAFELSAENEVDVVRTETGNALNKVASKKSERGIYASLVLPTLVIGTVGGGTQMPTAKESLDMIGCFGKGGIYRFAEIIASFALAMEISTLSALASDQFASAHDRLGRNRPE
ncbi:uncharacterized protein LOC144644911 isoform X1 [Oculina patagonica]